MSGRGQRRTPPRPPSATRPSYDPLASLEQQLDRLRAVTGATRISVWVHDPATHSVVPFRQAVCDGADLPVPDGTPIALSRSPFLAAVVSTERPVEARADGRRAEDRELAERGLRSAYAEPLLLDDDVIGVLTVEPAAAAAPAALRAAGPRLALALAEAWSRRSERHRLAQAEVLLGLIESAGTAESWDDLLGAACRHLTRLGDVERAEIVAAEGAMTADGDSVLTVPLGRRPDAGLLVIVGTRPLADDVRRLAVAVAGYLGGVVEQFRVLA